MADEHLHWQAVYRKIKEADNGIAVYDLCQEFDRPYPCQDIERTVITLLKNGKIGQAIGRTKSGLVARVVYLMPKDEPSRRGAD